MPKSKKDSVRLKDVARLAAVSLGTASQALNQRSNVSDDTRSRVIEAALSLGYLKDPLKTLSVQDISVVGMLTKHDENLGATVNPFHAQVQAGVEQACREYGLHLMVSALEVDRSNRPVALPAMLKEQHPDALLFIGTFLDDTIDKIYQDLEIPIVLIDSYAPNLPYDSVVTDNRQGAHLAVEHLLQQGHRCIGIVGSHEKSPPSVAERRQGYLEIMQKHGLKTYVEDSDLLKTTGYSATITLLERSPEVTAIFACNDEVAAGVLQVLREVGKRVPGDVSVVGFDNVDYAADLYPPLTTLHVHKTWMGRLGVRMLIERARNPNQPQTTCTVATHLVSRQSVAMRRPVASVVKTSVLKTSVTKNSATKNLVKKAAAKRGDIMTKT
ncbi:MAG: LacI family DNA-binding transcriptional regulator [Trueperaceae bacterium]